MRKLPGEFSMLKRTPPPPQGQIGMRASRLITVVLAAFVLSGCAALDPGPPPLTRAEIVQLSRSGESAATIIDRLRKTGTVLWLSATDIVNLRQAGVAGEVLDYLQAAQIAEARRQSQFDQLLYGPEMSPFSRCGGRLAGPGDRFSGFFSPFCF